MYDLHWIKNLLILYLPLGKPIILWGHRYSKNTIINQIKNLLLKKSNAIVLYNDTEIEKMKLDGIEKEKIFVAENTIHVENHENCSNYPKSSFLYVGRAQKRKKIDVLIRSFACIIDKIPKHITVDIIGVGNENDLLKDLVKKLKLEKRVFFHGLITDNNILKVYFKKAFAYVSPDAIGLGAQHSFAFGIPVITTSAGFKGAEFEKLEHNVNSVLYEEQSKLKEVLIDFIKNPELSQRLGTNSYNLYTSHLTIANMVNGFQKAIEYVNK
jgi:glycosyltransferase involved in cell wall biosynthesis